MEKKAMNGSDAQSGSIGPLGVMDAIRFMMASSGMNAPKVSEALGMGSKYLYNILRHQDVRVDTLARLASAMGFELVLRGRGCEVLVCCGEEDGEGAENA